MSDYGPKAQSFYTPVATPKELHRIDETARSFHSDDAKALCDGKCAKLPVGVRNRVPTPNNYGSTLDEAKRSETGTLFRKPP